MPNDRPPCFACGEDHPTHIMCKPQRIVEIHPGPPTAPPHPYQPLRDVLEAAFEQASGGKGSERHGNGKPFTEQPIFTIAALVGNGFTSGQAIKKITEAMGMLERGQTEAAQREFLGAIVYTAALYINAGK